MTTICPSCGAATRPQSRFCQKCGRALAGQAGAVTPQPRPARRPWLLLGGSLLLLLFLAPAVWWLLVSDQFSQVASNTGVPAATVAANTPVPAAGATATGAAAGAPPTPSPTPEPLIIPGTDIELPRLSDAEEIAIGQEVAREVEAEYGVLQDPAAQQRVAAIGQRIIPYSDRPDLPYHFTLLDTDEINAFAAPGGFIFVTRGMLAFANPSPDDELASVIGHEIAHIARRHGAKRIERVTLALAAIEAVAQRNQDWETIYQSQTGQITKEVVGELLVRGWGRNQEFDADHYGVLYMKQAGYDPNAAVMLFMRMQNAFPTGASGPAERLLSTHPPFADRIERMETVIQDNP